MTVLLFSDERSQSSSRVRYIVIVSLEGRMKHYFSGQRDLNNIFLNEEGIFVKRICLVERMARETLFLSRKDHV